MNLNLLKEREPNGLEHAGVTALTKAMKTVDLETQNITDLRTPGELAQMTRNAIENTKKKHEESIARNTKEIKRLEAENEISRKEIAGCEAYLGKPKQQRQQKATQTKKPVKND